MLGDTISMAGAIFASLVIVIDILLGVAKGWAGHKLESRKFREGLVTHGFMAAMLWVGVAGDGLAHSDWVSTILTTFISLTILAYLLSIVENLQELGAPIPNWFVAKLRVAQDGLNDTGVQTPQNTSETLTELPMASESIAPNTEVK